jgi:hypothetical protein
VVAGISMSTFMFDVMLGNYFRVKSNARDQYKKGINIGKRRASKNIT